MYLRSANNNQNENGQNLPSSKEANIINNNLISMQRFFGREISNLPNKNALDDAQNKGSKRLPQGISAKVINVSNEPKLISQQNAKIGTREGAMVDELANTASDPLLSNGCQNKMMRQESIQDETIEDCDRKNFENPQFVAQYAPEIFQYLHQIESNFIPTVGKFAQVQTDINEKMRAILIDWLVDVHLKFKLVPETLFLTVNLIDRFLEKTTVSRQKLQLVGVSAMLIACKYEEIYPPEVKDFVYVTDKAYSREEVLDMEGKIISALQFNLTTPSSLRFLERYGILAELDDRSYNFCKYMLELALIEYKMLKYTPSHLAAGAVLLCTKLQKKGGWTDVLKRNSTHDEPEVKMCAKDLLILLQNAEKLSLQAVRRKFSSTKYLEVAKLQLEANKDKQN